MEEEVALTNNSNTFSSCGLVDDGEEARAAEISGGRGDQVRLIERGE